MSKKSFVTRIYLPPDANTLLSVADNCLRSRNYVNLIIAGKQPQFQWLNMEKAREHCSRGASIWEFASNDDGHPDVVLACAGDVPTIETIATAWLLRKHVPDIRVRVVNVVDLMCLAHHKNHPHGMDELMFKDLFTEETPVVFAFHGYPRVIHELIHGRGRHEQFHVRGYIEEGTTTTPFDMVVLNEMSRYHLAIEALHRIPRLHSHASEIIGIFEEKLFKHNEYIRHHLEDMPEVKDWSWTGDFETVETKREVGLTD